MLHKRTLDPDSRTLYGEALRPPPGYAFDAAVATTFSLDFETALSVPVMLAQFAAGNGDDLLRDPLALLEAAERIAGRVFVFTEAGRIHAQRPPHTRLCSLLEQVVLEVTAPRGGAFHPKIWVIRYMPEHGEGRARLRLLVLSRNLTRDHSWDTALTLDGEIMDGTQRVNGPLVRLLHTLPDLATTDVSAGVRGLVDELATDLQQARWNLPEGFDKVAFAVNGLGGKQWRPDGCNRLGVISPFCDDDALSTLAELASAAKPLLMSRPDELSCVGRGTLDRFEEVTVLDDMAVLGDGDEDNADRLRGLHAKVFIAERGWDTSITVGSGNATRSALLTGRNVEVFATLTGKRSRVGSVAGIMGVEGFGRLTRLFVPGELGAVDAEERAAEARLEKVRAEICAAGLQLQCQRAGPTEGGESLWNVWLTPRRSLALDDMGRLRGWPITRGEGHARDLLAVLRNGESADLGVMPLIDVTRFLAFELQDEKRGEILLFSTGLVIDGLPADRHAAILRSFICNKQTFLRYLRFLLANVGGSFGEVPGGDGAGHGTWHVRSDDSPLLEEMVRAFCGDGDQLREVERLISRLESPENGEDPIPAEFRTLWETFRTALKAREATRGG